MAEDQRFEHKADCQRRWQRQQERQPEISGPGTERGHQIGPHHILDAMRQIDEVHHAEHECKPRSDEEENEAELQTVQNLNKEECRCHVASIDTIGTLPELLAIVDNVDEIIASVTDPPRYTPPV